MKETGPTYAGRVTLAAVLGLIGVLFFAQWAAADDRIRLAGMALSGLVALAGLYGLVAARLMLRMFVVVAPLIVIGAILTALDYAAIVETHVKAQRKKFARRREDAGAPA